MLQLFQHIDERFFLFLNGLNSPFFDHVMFWLSGKLTWLPLYLFIITWVIYRKKIPGIWIIVSTLLLFAATDASSVHLFKDVFERLRPCHDPDLKGLVHLVNGHCGGKYGFISSHAANTFGMAVFISLMMREKWLGITLLLWAGIVSYSRIYLGVHYPSDVIVGALWGSGLAFGMQKVHMLVFSWLKQKKLAENS